MKVKAVPMAGFEPTTCSILLRKICSSDTILKGLVCFRVVHIWTRVAVNGWVDAEIDASVVQFFCSWRKNVGIFYLNSNCHSCFLPSGPMFDSRHSRFFSKKNSMLPRFIDSALFRESGTVQSLIADWTHLVHRVSGKLVPQKAVIVILLGSRCGPSVELTAHDQKGVGLNPSFLSNVSLNRSLTEV